MATQLPDVSDLKGVSSTKRTVGNGLEKMRDFLAGLFGADGKAATALAAVGILDSDGRLPASMLTTGLTRKNLLINGGFDIWQRGTSFTNPAAGYNAADRWRLEQAATGLVVSRQAFTPGQTAVPGNPAYFMRLVQTVSTGNTRFIQRIEGQFNNALSGQKCTLSFYTKSPDGALLNAIYFAQDGFATGARTDTSVGAVTPLTTSWVKHTYTVTFPSVTGKTLDSGTYSSVEFYFVNNAGGTIDIANAQLEPGGVATEFEYRPFAEELALCKRYYERQVASAAFGNFAAGFNRNTSIAQGQLKFEVQKRIIPTITSSAASSFRVAYLTTAATLTGLSFSQVNVRGLRMDATISSAPLTAGQGCIIDANNDAAAYFAADAEI